MKLPVLLLVLALVFAAALVVAALKRKGNGHSTEAPTRKAPLTKREQAMYFRLVEAFPEHVVLAQVAFSSLLTARTTPARNRFDRKVADFVVCSKAFEVIAAVELDDSSHDNKEARDQSRDALLTGAGYTVRRYRQIPDLDQLKRDFAPPAEPNALQPPRRIKA